MKKHMTIEQLKKSKVWEQNKHLFENPQPETANGKIVSKHFKHRSKEKDFISWNLFIWSQENGHILKEEFKFSPERRWRFDWAIEEIKLAVEYEGTIFDPNGDHRSVKGMSRDIEKYNEAQNLGWTVLRFTCINYKTLVTALKKYNRDRRNENQKG